MIQQIAASNNIKLSWSAANTISLLSKEFWDGGAQSSDTYLWFGKLAALSMYTITNKSDVFVPYRGDNRFTSGDNDDISGKL